MYEHTLQSLLQIPIDHTNGPTIVRLTSDAQAKFHDFEARIEQELGTRGGLASRTDWGGKLCGAIARIALVLHALQSAASGRSCGEIDLETVTAALNWAPYLVDHESRVAGVVGADTETTIALRLLNWLERNDCDRFSRRDAFSQNRSEMVRTVEDIDTALSLLEECGYIRRRSQNHQESKVGRPASRTFEVNPNLDRGDLQ